MDIEKDSTRSRDGEGVPGEALDVVTVTEETITPKFARPSFLDRSRSGITEAQVGEMTVRVYNSPAYRGSTLHFLCYEIAWNGKVLWTEFADEAEVSREMVEAASVERADQLTDVVWKVGGMLVDGPDRPCWDIRDSAVPVVWTGLPDKPADPTQ